MNTISILAISGVVLGVVALILLVLAAVKPKEKEREEEEEYTPKYLNDDEEDEEEETYRSYPEEEEEMKYSYSSEPEFEPEPEPEPERTIYDFDEQVTKQREIKPEFVRSSDRRQMIDEFIPFDKYESTTSFGDEEDEEEEEINIKIYEPTKYDDEEIQQKKRSRYVIDDKDEDAEESVSDRLAKLTAQFEEYNR